MRFFAFALLIISAQFFSCKKRNVHVSVMKPAPLTVPQDIEKLAIINRTLPENDKANIIEGILTAETPGQDRQGAFEAVGGLNTALGNSPRFSCVLTNVKLKGSGSGGVFPEPLPWKKVEELCRENDADAIVSLETYDSDFIVTYANKYVDKKNEDGTVVKTKVYYAKGVGTVKLGFRLYDPGRKTIADQFHFSHTSNWSTSGQSPQEALARLIGRNAAINRISNDGGAMYAARISPTWVRVTREFYKKAGGVAEMKIAGRRASVNDWEGAEKLWTEVFNSRNRKASGKAAYNIAIAREVQGDLEGAKEWAQIAYTDYKIKPALNYTYIIERRISEQLLLKEQLGE